MNKAVAVLLLIASLFTAFIVGAVLQYSLTIPSTGTIMSVGVKVTWLSDDTEVNSVDWGIMDNDTEYTLEPFKITNTNNTACTLTMNTTNLSPNILSLTQSWNYTEGTVLEPNMYVVIALTLKVAIIDAEPYTLTYDTVIIATEV